MSIHQHTIAVVYDDPNVRRAMARLLSELGYRVVPFASAADYLRTAATSAATCVIVDVDLCDASGLDLVRVLSAAGLRCPTIFISGSDDDAVRMQCIDLGCVAYLRKPLSDDGLIDAVARAIKSNHEL